MRPYLKNTHHTPKKGLVEWLMVKALSSSPSSENKTQTQQVGFTDELLKVVLYGD
jgi:hypothetical protein